MRYALFLIFLAFSLAWPFYNKPGSLGPAIIWVIIAVIGIALGSVHLYLRVFDRQAQKKENGLIKLVGDAAVDREIMRLWVQVVFIFAGLLSFIEHELVGLVILTALFSGQLIIVGVTVFDLITRRKVSHYQESKKI